MGRFGIRNLVDQRDIAYLSLGIRAERDVLGNSIAKNFKFRLRSAPGLKGAFQCFLLLVL